MHDLVLPRGSAQPGRTCDELLLCDEHPEVTLDLRALSFVGPLFLVRLRAWLDHHDLRGIRVKVVPPDSRDVSSYMSRMHVPEGLGGNIDFPLPTVNENPAGSRLIAVTRLEASGSDSFDELLGGLLGHEDMRGAGYLAEVIAETAEEMMLNAVEHGANPVGAYVAAQRFVHKDTPTPNHCVVAVGDMGIGMADHLRNGGQGRATDSETIAHGLTELISGTGVEYRGRGFVVPFEVAQDKGAASAHLRVRANSGLVTKNDGQAPIPLGERDPCTGTWVEFSFRHAHLPG